jgi:type IV pilus assembly protein PilC
VAVLVVATIILGVLTVLVIPKFKEVFAGLGEGRALPGFTQFVLNVSDTIRNHFLYTAIGVAAFVILFILFIKTKFGRRVFDKVKLKAPVIGPVVSKVAISRFSRTLGTLVSSGVPILQALTIVRETAGNVIVSNAVGSIHDSVKEGETITAPLEASGVFPPMVVSMVDVGEQTGALPEMLLKIADNYDEEVDNAVAAMTSLLEPIMIVFLAVIVGSIVIAMFLPLIDLMNNLGGGGDAGD